MWGVNCFLAFIHYLDKISRVKKAYKCKCGKSYKTAQNLKSHSAVHTVTTLATAPSSESPRIQATKTPGLVVTAAPSRNLSDDKMLRVYDTIKTKDGTAFTIPKHGRVSVVTAGQIRHANITSAVASVNADKVKVDRNPKVTVYKQPFSFGHEI